MRDQQTKMTSSKLIGSKIIMYLATSMLALAYAPANADQNDPKLKRNLQYTLLVPYSFQMDRTIDHHLYPTDRVNTMPAPSQ